jgi:hypothetical protein
VGGPSVYGGNEAAFGPWEIFVARKGPHAEEFVEGWVGLDGMVKINNSPSFREFDFDVGWPVRPKQVEAVEGDQGCPDHSIVSS